MAVHKSGVSGIGEMYVGILNFPCNWNGKRGRWESLYTSKELRLLNTTTFSLALSDTTQIQLAQDLHTVSRSTLDPILSGADFGIEQNNEKLSDWVTLNF